MSLSSSSSSTISTHPQDDPVVAGITEIFNNPDIDFPECVFKVPNSLSASKPEAYCPQVTCILKEIPTTRSNKEPLPPDDHPTRRSELISARHFVYSTSSKLCDVGVKFSSSDCITGIMFDPATALFKLPIVKLNNNSEVVIRNLVAYEEMYKPESEPLVFTGYIEMMSGIIQTAEDVKVLRGHQVLDIEFLKDDEVAKIFTGVIKLVRSANAPNIDKAITDVNNFYNGTCKG
ncbi:hypothetical protein CJ030_MR8G010110 [Morella rubra]|uniref:Uncharacterized protein n=1 Tax=Morella rubra TaxID=262757 RepID=A0A6A1UQ38_9ROSI|nr:hypothetical protein CJ030_MR8G010110 [Morella rubra]